MQDVEFTIEQGPLYILQTRAGKRTAQAAVRVARDLVAEGVIDRATRPCGRIDPASSTSCCTPASTRPPTTTCSPRASTPRPAPRSARRSSTPTRPRARGRAGEAVILVRWETTPDDIHGVIQAQAVVTAHGGMTSHAAVVARGMGKPCVCGVESLAYRPGGAPVHRERRRPSRRATRSRSTAAAASSSAAR